MVLPHHLALLLAPELNSVDPEKDSQDADSQSKDSQDADSQSKDSQNKDSQDATKPAIRF